MIALELVQEVAMMMGWPVPADLAHTPLSKEEAAMVGAANSVLSSLQGDADWKELSTSAVLRLPMAKKMSGVTNIAYGSSTLSILGGLFAGSDVDSVVQVSGYKAAYRIISVVSGNTVILDRVWAESAIINATIDTYVGKASFDLPTDYDRFLVETLYNQIAGNDIRIVGPSEFSFNRKKLGLGLNIGEPEVCTISGLNTAGTSCKIHFDRVANRDYDVDFQYQKKHPKVVNGTEAVLYPQKDIIYIKDMIKALLDRDNEAAQTAAQVSANAMQDRARVQAQRESGDSPVRISVYRRKHGRFRRF